jgi:hypothetical protein
MAELMSSLGAGILGVGIGVLAADYLRRLDLTILVAGLLFHAWGMTEKHRLENQNGAPGVWWWTFLFWICWLFLLVLAGYVVGGRF